MARLLLGSPVMRASALLVCCLSGCLYVDRLNHAPTVTLEMLSATSTIKGGALLVHARLRDDEDDTAALLGRLHFDVAAADGSALGPCDYTLQSGETAVAMFFRTGVFSLTARTTDHLGAQSNSASVMITISDAPPVIAQGGAPVATTTRNACADYTAGDTVTLAPPADIVDADANANASARGCDTRETLRYTWRIDARPSGTQPVLTKLENNACAPPTAASGTSLEVSDAKAQVCLWTDAATPAGLAMYSVLLEVGDGVNVVDSAAADVPVAADAPPCIDGTEPIAGALVVSRADTQQLLVTGAVDDRDRIGAGLTFAWSVWRASDPTWRRVPMYTSNGYALDTSNFGVGESVRVRVEAVDRTGALATTCDLAADDCVVSSCAAGSQVCDKWKTWDLELR